MMLLGFTALAVDMGYIYNLHGEMQVAVDAGALAGATGAPYSNSLARTRALGVAGANPISGSGLTKFGVKIGYWDFNSHTFSIPSGLEIANPNAARVVGSKEGIPLFFGNALGNSSTAVAKDATAVYGAGACVGIWGLDGVHVEGDILTDSYDSSVGPYAQGNIQMNGDLCSEESILIDGGVNIGGDVMYGHGYDLTINGNSSIINGNTGSHDLSADVPTIDMATAALVNDNLVMPLTDTKNLDPFGGTQWDLTFPTGQDTLTINGGTYYLTSALLEGQSQIIVTAQTTFYIDGPARFAGGGIVNASGDPRNLIIYSTGETLEIAGGAGFYGAVIAPDTNVTFTGGGDIYGTVMAGYLEISGDAVVHVDNNVISEILGVGPEAPILVE
jgi:hypothetical protein